MPLDLFKTPTILRATSGAYTLLKEVKLPSNILSMFFKEEL